jgi:hypothetical protein
MGKLHLIIWAGLNGSDRNIAILIRHEHEWTRLGNRLRKIN